MKRNLLFSLLLIFCFGVFLRFYKLSEIPSGLEQDETSIGYNAYSILKTGKDEYGLKYPLNFKAFGEYKLPGYIYASVLPIKYFGLNAFGVRFISALSGSLTILIIFFLTRELFEKHPSRDALALLSTLLLALNPWHLHFSRGAFEVTLAFFFLCAGLLCFLYAIRRKKLIPLLASALFFSGSLYTYNISRLFVPVLGITLLWVYRKSLSKLPIRWLYASAIFTILLLLPFLSTIGGKSGVGSTTGTLIFTSKAVQAPLLEIRSAINLKSPLAAKLIFNIPLLTIYQYIQNVTSYASVDFLFLTGAIHGNHGIGTDGQFYLFQLPLIVIGISLLWKKPKAHTFLLLAWTIEVILIASLTREAPQATRSFNLILPMTLFSSLGLLWIVEQRKIAFTFLLSCFVIFSVPHYLVSYFYRFPIVYSLQWNGVDRQVVDYIRANQDQYDHIVFDQRIPFPYTSLLFYLPYSPSTFQENVVRANDSQEGFSKVNSFEKYQFANINWGDLSRKHDTHSLVITTYQFIPKDVPVTILETIYFPETPHVLSKNEEFFFFSEKKEAYVILRVN